MEYRTPSRRLQVLATLFGIVAFVLVQPAFAAPVEPTASPVSSLAVPAITVTEQGLAPNDAVTGNGHAFVLESGVSSLVVVSFALQAGQRVACAAPGRTPRLARVFALTPGATLVCHAMPGRYAFTANHPLQLASGDVASSRVSGWIEIS